MRAFEAAPPDVLEMLAKPIKELGLKLNPQKHPMTVLVIDHLIQKPKGYRHRRK